MGKKGSKSYDTGKVQFIETKEAGKGQKGTGTQNRGSGNEPNEMKGDGTRSTRLTREPKSIADRSLQKELSKLKARVDEIPRASLKGTDAETLKKYILLKEAEVGDLREQVVQYQDFLRKISAKVEELTTRNKHLEEDLDESRRKQQFLKDTMHEVKAKHEEELLRSRKEQMDNVGFSSDIEEKFKDLRDAKQEWKEKVQEDLRRIKLKERELENKYELLKRDAQALLDSKDKHVLELKNKNDAFELELEALEEKLRTRERALNMISVKKQRLIDTFKLAISLMEEIDSVEDFEDSDKEAG